MQLNPVFGVWLRALLALVFFGLASVAVRAEEKVIDDRLGAGDVIKVQVYKSPDLSAEFRIQENGSINFPLIGSQILAGKPLSDAEKQIAAALVAGGFLQSPQVSISLLAARRKQVSVLGYVAKPGVVPLEYVNTRLSDVLAMAGGIAPAGSDSVIVTGKRNGAPFRAVVDIAVTYLDGKPEADLLMAGGDVVYVHRAQVFYAYGEVQRPGAYRLEHEMTLQQALVTAGGLTKRGTDHGLRVQRRKADGSLQELTPALSDVLLPDDVLFAHESIF